MFFDVISITVIASAWAWWWCVEHSIVRTNVAESATLLLSGPTIE